ncbi:MAG: hypothetical protein ACI9WS_003335, partial [Paraglaciecola psychrophila]
RVIDIRLLSLKSTGSLPVIFPSKSNCSELYRRSMQSSATLFKKLCTGCKGYKKGFHRYQRSSDTRPFK